MELHPKTFPESLKATLNCYQLTSIDSLSGPSGYPALAAQMWFKENKQLPPIPSQPMLPIPYLMQNDKSVKRSETILAGEKIACFIVGGEKRLCLPQILTSVLREYSIAEINQACAELHIYCSRCLPEQLDILKVMAILPLNTAQCGLITKTDAERLVALLTDQHEPVKSMCDQLPKDVDPDNGFHVYHECFGRAYGKLYPELYVTPVSQCIMCEDCRCMYSPQRFITHSHRSFEKRTCHWGFDPEHWRHYLVLPRNLDSTKREELEKVLGKVKARFEQPSRYEVPCAPPTASSQYTSSADNPPTPVKRRFESEQESPMRKKIKEENKIIEANLLPHLYASLPFPVSMRHSAFRPWSPRLTTLGGSNPTDTPVISDLPHMKGMLPLGFDRRGYAQYLQNGRPVVLRNRASDFSLPPPAETRGSRSPSTEEQKKSLESRKLDCTSSNHKSPTHILSAEKDSNNNHDTSASALLSQKNEPRNHRIGGSPEKLCRKLSVSPCRPQKVVEVSPQARTHSSPTRYVERSLPAASQPHYPYSPARSTSMSLSCNNNNTLRDPRDEYEIARPISRSRAAAATAMLELKSAGYFRSGEAPVSLSHPPTPPLNSTPSDIEAKTEMPRKDPVTSPCPESTKAHLLSDSVVVPLDASRQHYKWTIGGHSYIVSSSGFQSLEMLRSLLQSESENDPGGKNRIMHELVKMKSLFEEKLDIELRVRKDLEMEIEHMKAAQREKRQITSDARKQMKQDMENMRREYDCRLEELLHSEERLREQLDNAKRGLNREKSPSGAEKEIKDLKFRIRELEMRNDKLHSSLIEERERRVSLESKLEDASEGSRGRVSFFMESPLSRMVRGVSRKSHEEDSAKPHSRSYHTPQNLSSQANIMSTTSISQHAGNQLPVPISVNGQITVVHRKSPPSALDTSKTVVVS